MTKGKVDGVLLDEIIRRIVATAHPIKIILFGSGAREQLGPESDLDILVIKDVTQRRALAVQIHRSLRGLEIGVDLIVATSDDLNLYKDSTMVIVGQALKEGRVIYDSAA